MFISLYLSQKSRQLAGGPLTFVVLLKDVLVAADLVGELWLLVVGVADVQDHLGLADSLQLDVGVVVGLYGDAFSVETRTRG